MNTTIDQTLIPIIEDLTTTQDLQLSSQERRTLIDDKVRSMILRGQTRAQCLKFIKKESARLGFENTDSQCSNIFHQVKSTLKNELEENRDELLADVTSKMYYLYGRNIENEDLKEARECLKEIAKLVGVGINQVNIQKENENIQINFGFSE